MQLECPGTFVERGAGRHHVINQRDAFAGQVGGTMKSAADVLDARPPGQFGLCRRMPNARADAGINRPATERTDRPRKFKCLVEAALTQAQRMQWQRNDQVSATITGAGGQLLAEPLAECQPVGVLE